MLKFLKDLFSSAPPAEGEKHPLDGPTKKAVEVVQAPVEKPTQLAATWPFPTGEKPVAKKETSAKEKPAKAAKPAAPKTAKPKAPPKPKTKKK